MKLIKVKYLYPVYVEVDLDEKRVTAVELHAGADCEPYEFVNAETYEPLSLAAPVEQRATAIAEDSEWPAWQIDYSG